jgi:DnaJ-domain-containing protein 1
MLYLLLGGAALTLYLWVGKRKIPVLKRREWRVLTAAMAVACFTAAVFVSVRGGWGAGIVLAVAGLGLASSARKTAMPGVAPPSEPMSAEEARRILGVTPSASRQDVQEAYTRLMRAVHPDKGGTAGLAAQLNAARDRLLKR